MSSDRKTSPTAAAQPPVGSRAAKPINNTNTKSKPNNITTNGAGIARQQPLIFPPPSSSSASDAGDMATPAFLPPPPPHLAFRPSSRNHHQMPFPLIGQPPLDRDMHSNSNGASPFGAAGAGAAPGLIRVLIRRLPLNTTPESLRSMVVWSKDLVAVELLPTEQSDDKGFRSAVLRFKSMPGALEVKNMLDGRANIANDAEMIVHILNGSPVDPRNGSLSGPSAFGGPFGPLDKISPPANGVFPMPDFSHPDAGFPRFFGTPIGSHLSDHTRVSGKTLINDDYADDDETSDLLKDPVAYAEGTANSQRRATAPQIPIGRMANLSLNNGINMNNMAPTSGSSNHSNKGSPPGASSLPPYMASGGSSNASNSNMSPGTSHAAPGLAFPLMQAPPSAGPPPSSGAPSGTAPLPSGPPYGRGAFPPVNPADQNPPCNTLYVGNLPLDTSEEELKAMFAKQRGYKRLCFRTKQNGPMCFVEFEDVTFATKALHELYGQPLHNSVKGGIRLSFSKNPLGVRSGQIVPPPPNNPNGHHGGHHHPHHPHHGPPGQGPPPPFSVPPPGLGVPPGLGAGGGGGRGGPPPQQHQQQQQQQQPGNSRPPFPFPAFPLPGAPGNPWSTPTFGAGAPNGHQSFLPRQHMTGR